MFQDSGSDRYFGLKTFAKKHASELSDSEKEILQEAGIKCKRSVGIVWDPPKPIAGAKRQRPVERVSEETQASCSFHSPEGAKMQHHSPSGEDLEDDDEAEKNEKEEGLSEEGDSEELKQKLTINQVQGS